MAAAPGAQLTKKEKREAKAALAAAADAHLTGQPVERHAAPASGGGTGTGTKTVAEKKQMPCFRERDIGKPCDRAGCEYKHVLDSDLAAPLSLAAKPRAPSPHPFVSQKPLCHFYFRHHGSVCKNGDCCAFPHSKPSHESPTGSEDNNGNEKPVGKSKGRGGRRSH